MTMAAHDLEYYEQFELYVWPNFDSESTDTVIDIECQTCLADVSYDIWNDSLKNYIEICDKHVHRQKINGYWVGTSWDGS